MSSHTPYHEITTVGNTAATASAPTTTTTSDSQDYSSKAYTTGSQDYSSKGYTTGDQNFSSRAHTTGTHTTQNDPDTISAAPAATLPRDGLNSEYEPTTEITQPRGSLSSTTGPFQVPTTDDVSKKDSALTSSVGQQTAPGRAGSIGDKTLSAFGYGGSKVERPKEDQGLGEKIVNFFGA